MCRPKYAMSSPVGTWMVDRVDLADVVCSDPAITKTWGDTMSVEDCTINTR